MFLSSGLAEAVVVNCHMPIDIEKKVMLKVVGNTSKTSNSIVRAKWFFFLLVSVLRLLLRYR